MIMIGPDFKEGAVIENCHNVDIAPTVAHLFGLDMPDVDGKVLKDALK